MKIKGLLQSECFVLTVWNLPPFEFIEYFCSCASKQKIQSQRASLILGGIPAFGADLETNGSKKKSYRLFYSYLFSHLTFSNKEKRSTNYTVPQQNDQWQMSVSKITIADRICKHTFQNQFFLMHSVSSQRCQLDRLTLHIRWAYLIKWEWRNDNILLSCFRTLSSVHFSVEID